MHGDVVHHQTGSHESRSHGKGCKGNGQLRQEEKARDTETIADSQEAQTGMLKAVTVSEEFYAKAAETTALLQQQQESPEIFEESYKGMDGENGGVVEMLKVIGLVFFFCPP